MIGEESAISRQAQDPSMTRHGNANCAAAPATVVEALGERSDEAELSHIKKAALNFDFRC
jgi:hypothetical protein